MTSGSSMQAMTRRVPPHFGQVSISMANTRFSRCIHVMGASGWPGFACSGSRLGTMRCRCFAVRGEHAVAAGEVESGSRRQRGEAGDKVEWIEHDMRRAVAKGLLEPNDDLPAFVHREPLVGDGGAGDGAAELFELVTLVGLAAGCGVPGKTRLPGEQG